MFYPWWKLRIQNHITHIKQAQDEILVQAYAFTSKNIADALLSAAKKGIKVAVVYDRKSAKDKYSQIPRLQKAGVKTIADKVQGISHNKIMIIDKKIVVTGSFNWTVAAEKRNSENIIFLANSKLAEEYIKNWQQRANR